MVARTTVIFSSGLVLNTVLLIFNILIYFLNVYSIQ